MTITNEDIAEIIDKAHDEILVRGWGKRSFVDQTTGAVCSAGALLCASGVIKVLPIDENDKIHYITRNDPSICGSQKLYSAAHLALRSQGQLPQATPAGEDGLFTWNDDRHRTVDEVLDLFRNTSKALRNGEISVV